MSAQERAELELLRQQHEALPEGPGGGEGDEGLLHRLKTLPEHEAMALLLQMRTETRVKEVSSPLQPGPVCSGPLILALDSQARSLTLVMVFLGSCYHSKHSSALADER